MGLLIEKKKLIVKLILIAIWPFMYIGTRSYETTFIFLAFLAVCGVIQEEKLQTDDIEGWKLLHCCVAAIASLALMMADYSMFLGRGKLGIVEALAAFVIGVGVWHYIFSFLARLIANSCTEEKNEATKRKLGICGFLLPFIIDSIFLIFVEYPGYIQPDSCEQLREILTGDYANLNPVWHTKFIEMIFKPVYAITGNGNLAAAAFCMFQLILFALVISYTSLTLYEIGIKEKCILAFIIIYSLMPQNIVMSCSLVKDSAFALGCMLWVVTIFRILNNCQHKNMDYVLYVIATLMCCLFRKNGMIAIMGTTVFIVVVSIKEKYWILCACTLITVASTVVLDKAVVDYLGFSQPDAVESLHIPLQQIARVGVDEKELTDYELQFVQKFCDYDEFVSVYNPQNADYVKNNVRYRGDKQYIADNKGEFIKVWVSIGIHHPGNYIKAWIDQTWAVWSGSTFYSTWEGTVSDRIPLDEYGIYAVEHNNVVAKLWDLWNGMIARNKVWFAEVILAVGIRLWLIAFCVISAIRNRQSDFVVGIMPIMLIGTLAIATPIGHEFRYAYGLFTAFPMVIFGLLSHKATK